MSNCRGRTRWGVESRRGPIFCAVLILCSSVTNHVHALLGLSEEGFGVFHQADPFADPFGDLGDPDLSETELMSVGTSSRAEMGLKRKPPTSLFDLIEGQPGKGAQGKL